VIALDTHTLVWWVAEPARIPVKARRLLERAVEDRDAIAVSSISVWEIATLVERGRLELTIDVDAWLSRVQALPYLAFHAADNSTAARAARLPDFPYRDPADRLIVATALELGATLITGDRKLRAYRPLSTAWD